MKKKDREWKEGIVAQIHANLDEYVNNCCAYRLPEPGLTSILFVDIQVCTCCSMRTLGMRNLKNCVIKSEAPVNFLWDKIKC